MRAARVRGWCAALGTFGDLSDALDQLVMQALAAEELFVRDAQLGLVAASAALVQTLDLASSTVISCLALRGDSDVR